MSTHEKPAQTVEFSAAERARFEAKVDRSPGQGPWGNCHEWSGSTVEKGYGRVKIRRLRRSPLVAHRVAFAMEHGRWPAPCTLHSCDNGLCCNVAHLDEGTVAQNNAEMLARGRAVPPPRRSA